MVYNVWIEWYGSSAKNAGLVCSTHPTKADWTTDKLRWIANYRERSNYLFIAPNDTEAFKTLSSLVGSPKPLSGKSYMRQCRVTETR